MAKTDSPPVRYRIAETARLSGFTPSALRYYEQAGVLTPAERTPAGYRLYDGRDLERLRLIARAKDLGCTLEEATDLLRAWDDDECGPVKHRLRALVDAKLADVQMRLAEQSAFAAQLQATAAALRSRPLDGPCDDSCGCTAVPDIDTEERSEPANAVGCGCAAPAGPAAVGRQDGPATPSIACSLGPRDVQDRIDEWQAVLGDVAERQAITNGLRLDFGPQASVTEIARLARAEYDCCAFFAFALTVDGRGVALEVTAPEDGQAMLHDVFGEAA